MEGILRDTERAEISESLDWYRNKEVMCSSRSLKITYAEVYRAMGHTDGPVTHIIELSDKFGVRPNTVRNRLKKMMEHDVVTLKKMGERTEVWYFGASNDTDPFHPENFIRFREFIEEVLSDD